MATPNVYYLTDDSGFSAGPAGGSTGGGSGAPITPEFTAPSIGAAAQVAYIISSALSRPVRLVTKYNNIGVPPWTLVVGIGATNALTSVPSGISY